jgi:polysaccharide export outer membrane protein
MSLRTTTNPLRGPSPAERASAVNRLSRHITRRLRLFSRFLILLLLPAAAFAQGVPSEGDYVLAPGDVVQVRVYGEDDLSMELAVPGSGRVEYAFVGEFELAGKSVRTVQQEIHDRLLGDYLIEPRVSVSVSGYRDFYVYGEVASPGGYDWEPGLTVRKVITLAGGLKERASGSKWYLVPEGASEANRIKVDEDYPVQPGDTLTIEQSFF